ncbi:hypothetical protein [Labrenzia sp. DG1229]|uniref:hypothetical protein n=1 Tax=Labrenzia sp. DG1229 TaxID=681847 RepID=UPI00048DAAD9|nr:hypothetical protein [Labrenzia sp. DG1229]
MDEQNPSASGRLQVAEIGGFNLIPICVHPATQYQVEPKTGFCEISKWQQCGTGLSNMRPKLPYPSTKDAYLAVMVLKIIACW